MSKTANRLKGNSPIDQMAICTIDP
jgi:hypothetical protein